jgi:hypothetical protein
LARVGEGWSRSAGQRIDEAVARVTYLILERAGEEGPWELGCLEEGDLESQALQKARVIARSVVTIASTSASASASARATGRARRFARSVTRAGLGHAGALIWLGL